MESEPPGFESVKNEVDEEPPSRLGAFKNRFFSNVSDKDWYDWHWQFRNRITTVDELARIFPLAAEEVGHLKQVVTKYPLSISPYYLSLINISDPEDPVRKQSIPSFLEIAMDKMGVEDPLCEKEDSVVTGLVHRYPDRVLMVLTDICPMLCRHCTRKREWQHGGWVRSPAEIEAIIDYIRKNKKV
ncbi:MAG: lysine 2,3-aminomutase, partial [Chloroflexi bacterium]|nr:lysine 2,3-aminomutase [Chloroflexota bacterium]